MNEYLLILHDPTDSAFLQLSPEEMQTAIARYGQWAEQLASQGRMRGGHKLEDGTARQLSGTLGNPTVTDGPFPETKEVIGGYFLIAAASYEEAVVLSSTCPHLDFGRIEIRRIEPM
ncbi:MAG TPA: YciI family protein [Bryobacteraceae bacterium]|nr:YciI family protein [Bryobacteraceae bacterium]